MTPDPAGAAAVRGERRAGLERNLRLIPYHQALTRSMVWAPVFVLFSRARFGLDGALLLGSLYYLFVVVLEVPSGWLSDRLGRVVTLRIAAVGFVGAQSAYLVGDESFGLIVLGQFLLAVGFASLSGTDVAFHYDTLEAVGEEASYTRRQARVGSYGFAAAAASAVLGGLLGLIDLRLTFAASLMFAVAQLVSTLFLTEPPSTGSAELLGRQLTRCLAYLRDRYVGWIFGYGIILVTLEHVVFTMMQPWLTEVLGRTADEVGRTPLVSGLVFAVVAFVGAGAAKASAPLSERFGTVATLIGLGALSAAIVTGMVVAVHWAVLVLVAFRSAQGAAAPVLISAAIAPRTDQQHRATLLSVNSLAGRLSYGLLLYAVSAAATDEVRPVLAWFSLVSWTMVVVLAVSAAAVLGPASLRRPDRPVS